MKILRIICVLLVTNICHNLFAQNSDGDQIKTQIKVDACVYGGTASGVLAAVALAREGYSVAVIELTHEIGGLLASGFRMAQDVPYADHLGGLTGEFYQTDINFPALRHRQGASKYSIAALYELIAPYKDLINVVTDHRLVSVQKEKSRIKSGLFEFAPPDENGVPIPYRLTGNLTRVEAKIFIDASYEGDLMAYSGVNYTIGRESRDKYGESLAGVTGVKEFPGVDPFKIKGKPKSGLLNIIDDDPIGKEGDSSRFFMAYNFKFSWEDNPTREFPGIPIMPPKNKNEDVYTLLNRFEEAGYHTTWPHENLRRNELMTGAIPGAQVNYPDGDWPTRSKIWQGYVDHIKTLTDWSGKEVRLLTDNNTSTNGWPSALYIRCGRRMLGDYVLKQQDIQLQTDIKDPVCMGYYMVDIYPNRLGVTKKGVLFTEGNVWEMVCPGPYQIPYESIIPKKGEVENLLVSICISASHIAYSSIRMESTYMVIGESAGIAAAIALQNNQSVQGIDRTILEERLQKYNQKLAWDGKGYREWRYNFLDKNTHDYPKRWEKNPEEYLVYPVKDLWK
ncbi:MAG: FAD-dependent oxidoreductase [Cyclobacteriaceae bacterium]|nr:FAD-dependent oxidoreductase [Cyclobacteriaceae bacterium SS2]